jgi:hypothetical protein
MKVGMFVWVAAGCGIVLVASAGCGDKGPSTSPSTGVPSPSNGVWSVQIQTTTPASLQNTKCTSALAGTVAYVASPPSLWTCDGSGWNKIECDGDEAGKGRVRRQYADALGVRDGRVDAGGVAAWTQWNERGNRANRPAGAGRRRRDERSDRAARHPRRSGRTGLPGSSHLRASRYELRRGRRAYRRRHSGGGGI